MTFGFVARISLVRAAVTPIFIYSNASSSRASQKEGKKDPLTATLIKRRKL